MTSPNPSAPPVEKVSEQYYDFLREAENEEIVGEIDYDGLLDLEKKKFGREEDEEGIGGENDVIVFYCRDCEAIVPVQKKAQQKLAFECEQCKGSEIVYGTKRGISGYFKKSS
ncbi:MAG: hypothetical protein WCJ84_01710 [Candidatus Peregrinibacteria bacterium]